MGISITDILIVFSVIYCVWTALRGGCSNIIDRFILAVCVYICVKFILLKIFVP